MKRKLASPGGLQRPLSRMIRTLEPSTFRAAAIPPHIASLNAEVEAASAETPLLSAGTPQAARAARAHLFKHEPRREDIMIPALHGEGSVGLAIFRPAEAAPSRAAYLHMHGGGFLFGSAYGQNDARLQRMADALRIAVVSIDYRLAPEAAFPGPVDDCVAAALWLGEKGAEQLGTDCFVVGGESAGGHLCVSMLLRLRDEYAGRAPTFRCANLVYGWYDLGGSPSCLAFNRRLVLCREELLWMAGLFVPDEAVRTRRAGPEAGGVSPLYSSLHGMPPALFTVGTDDPLRDDTLMMAARWCAHGLDYELEVFPGAAHGVGHFGPHEHTTQGEEINARVDDFMARWIQ